MHQAEQDHEAVLLWTKKLKLLHFKTTRRRGRATSFDLISIFLFLLLVLILWVCALEKTTDYAFFSCVASKNTQPSFVKLIAQLFCFACSGFNFFDCALARPQRQSSIKQKRSLDIMLVMDTSGSMQALDFVSGQRHDRLQVVKAVVQEFVQQRTDDRLGMVIFGTHAFAQAPLTLDHDVLQQYLDRLEIGMAGEATAIGDALGVATNRLKELKSKNKVIILLTDGSNTAGKIDLVKQQRRQRLWGPCLYDRHWV